MESKARQSRNLQLITNELWEVCSHITTIKAGQQSCKPLELSKSYVSTSAKQKAATPAPHRDVTLNPGTRLKNHFFWTPAPAPAPATSARAGNRVPAGVEGSMGLIGVVVKNVKN
ncbi:hypothetical protein PGT21_017354 [Puccinia graminis f. sp. tritici]|uniref:Uncharacterized protein n=1 Tax=Puccinia graminis f. sp. tritici TaxID=56615 RepID=A0A5B0QIJ0_PUCGR|nr:hypothetical protein PGT21_017354 [Puccinia graminis f. sp. tritici]